MKRARRLWLIPTVTVGFLMAPAGAGAQLLLSDSFSGATTTSPLVPLNTNTPGFPCLTAGTNASATPIAGCALSMPDPVGSGALRLTDATPTANGEAAGIVYNTSFPTSAGLNITFDQYQYGGGGADGISFDLAVAPPQPTSIGQPGGPLGYASNDFVSPQLPGLPGGYLGIGLDAFGNFTNTDYDGTGCTDPVWASNTAAFNEVTVRGPGNGTVGYCLLSSSLQLGNSNPLNDGPIQLHSGSTIRPTTPESVNIQINPSSDMYTVGIDPAGGTNYQIVTTGALPTSYYDPTTGNLVNGTPPRLTFALAASTGTVQDVHEISNLTANTLTASVPVLTLSNTASSGGTVTAGSPDTYSLVAGVSAQSPVGETQPTTVQVTDPIPAGETLAGSASGTGWNCSASTATMVSCTNTSTAAIAPGASLPAISVPVTVDSSVAGQIVNTAQVISADAASPASGSATVAVAPGPGVVPGPPSVQTESAAFSATVSPNGSPTTVYFEYGLDSKYGLTSASNIYVDRTASQVVGAGTSSQTVTANVTGLVPDALYHVRVVATNAQGSATGADQTFTTQALAPPPPPVLGTEGDFTPVSGTVYVKLPGPTHARAGLVPALTKGVGFIPLTEARELPIGTEVDARAGTLKLTTATTATTRHKPAQTESGDFSDGLFKVIQSSRRALKGLTTLQLLDNGIFPGAPSYQTECAAVGKTTNDSSVFRPRRLSKKVLQTLLGNEHGKYQTRGKYSAATVRGTVFTVTDRCDATVTSVKRGEVSVTVYRQPHKSITLHTGQTYYAEAP